MYASAGKKWLRAGHVLRPYVTYGCRRSVHVAIRHVLDPPPISAVALSQPRLMSRQRDASTTYVPACRCAYVLYIFFCVHAWLHYGTCRVSCHIESFLALPRRAAFGLERQRTSHSMWLNTTDRAISEMNKDRISPLAVARTGNTHYNSTVLAETSSVWTTVRMYSGLLALSRPE